MYDSDISQSARNARFNAQPENQYARLAHQIRQTLGVHAVPAFRGPATIETMENMLGLGQLDSPDTKSMMEVDTQICHWRVRYDAARREHAELTRNLWRVPSLRLRVFPIPPSLLVPPESISSAAPRFSDLERAREFLRTFTIKVIDTERRVNDLASHLSRLETMSSDEIFAAILGRIEAVEGRFRLADLEKSNADLKDAIARVPRKKGK